MKWRSPSVPADSVAIRSSSSVQHRVRLGELREQVRALLRSSGHQVSPRDGDLLIARSTGLNEASVLSFPEREVPSSVARQCLDLARRRADGEPFAYLIGEREFYGRTFGVDRRVLVPRPETEHLIDLALALRLDTRSTVLDVGTGSGCLAITLQLERPEWRVLASDVSPGALALASQNARKHGAAVHIFGGDLLAPLGARLGRQIDLVVSNPPYVDLGDTDSYTDAVKAHEPHAALFAGRAGLEVFLRLAEELSRFEVSALVLEVGHRQASAVTQIFAPAFRLAEVRRDLQGHQRALLFEAAQRADGA